ncbi:unnamed protein product [Lymnaea stagnalis]|uniref:Uncharacterized protein n=1 Tax=Lymnaea stagnalis TaxID=6523 RepID=A0AAV2HR35_LYMST
MNFRILNIFFSLTCRLYMIAIASKTHKNRGDTDDPSCRQSNCLDRRCQEITIVGNSDEMIETPVVDPSMSGVKLDSITLTAQHCQSGSCDAWHRSNDTHVIVDGGCQAKFRVCLQRRGCQQRKCQGKTPEKCQKYNIVSKDQMELVPVGTEFGYVTSMKLLRQRSSVPCEQGKTFGFYKWIAFARKGCSGRFQICYEVKTEDSQSAEPSGTCLPSVVENPDWTCVDVKLLSRLKRPVDKTITDDDGKEVTIHSMDLVHQHSDISCEQGESFRSSGSVASAWGGCRGTFKICYGSQDEESATTAKSDSTDWTCVDVKLLSRMNRPVNKTITDDDGKEVTIHSMTLVHQHSDISCEQGESFRSSGSVARAWGGCRGTFKICYGSQAEDLHMTTTVPSASPDLKCVDVKLLSRIKRPVDKTITDDGGKEVTIHSMDLVHQHSDISCEQGESFRSSGSVASAWGGCRGTFKICYGPVNEEPAVDVIPEPPDLKCVDVNLLSTLNRPVERTITDDDGDEVTIHSMTLVNQQSDVYCGREESYSSTGSVARAWGGCRGTFRICYSS